MYNISDNSIAWKIKTVNPFFAYRELIINGARKYSAKWKNYNYYLFSWILARFSDIFFDFNQIQNNMHILIPIIQNTIDKIFNRIRCVFPPYIS